MRRYTVHVLCDECGEAHDFGVEVRLADGPQDRASLTQAFPDGRFPSEVAALPRYMFTCRRSGWSFLQEEPSLIFLVPVD